MSSFGEMWKAARNPPKDPTDLSFKGKSVLVTGANTGMGHAAAIKYAALGASPLILAVRTREKGEIAKKEIIQKTGCSPDIFIILTVDLSTFASVKKSVDDLNRQVPKLHVAQLAAGICVNSFKRSPDGHEMTNQVNVLSTALMAVLLLPKMIETGATPSDDGFVPHMSLINSVAHNEVTEDMVPPGQSLIQRLDDESKFDTRAHYFLAKLATWYVVQGLVDQCRSNGTGSNIVINASCPGLCKTDMGRDFPTSQRMAMAVTYFLVGRTPEQGARAMVSATALGPESNGKFWSNDTYPP